MKRTDYISWDEYFMGVSYLAGMRSKDPSTQVGAEGAKIYVSLFPCNECAKAIIQSGIKTIVYDSDKYADSPGTRASKRMLDAAGVRYYQYQRTGHKIILDM